MESAKRQRPLSGRRIRGRDKKYFNRPVHGNTDHPEISTFVAKKILHDVYAVMESKSVLLVHFRGRRLKHA